MPHFPCHVEWLSFAYGRLSRVLHSSVGWCQPLAALGVSHSPPRTWREDLCNRGHTVPRPFKLGFGNSVLSAAFEGMPWVKILNSNNTHNSAILGEFYLITVVLISLMTFFFDFLENYKIFSFYSL